MRWRFTDDERWAAARELTRGRETPTAAAILVGRHVRSGLVLVAVGVTLALVLTRTSVFDVVFPPRASSREPFGWQLPLGVVGMIVGGVAVIWLRGANRLSDAGHALPTRDPRNVLTWRQRRELDRRIGTGTAAPPSWAPVAFDRALRFITLPLPSSSWATIPLALASLTFTYRGPVAFLIVVWMVPLVAVALTRPPEKRFAAAAQRWTATHGTVSGPVAAPTPGT
ncbi:hypothetical protein [Nakamurella deserti]|uniref:hypothetical protein n=1 Tax=Nakamurella deserti TaxID=2164074 RepID=UPI000DBE576B|nr:hypothetical protein [Nakamurella deserti]